MTITDRIWLIINNSGLKAAEIAEKTGIDKSSFTRWKNRDYKPSLDAIIALSQFFDISTDYILLGKVDTLSKSDALSIDEENLMNIYRKLTNEDKIKVNKIITDILIESLLENNESNTTPDDPLNFPSESSEVVKIGLAAFGGNGYIEKTISKEDAERGLREIEKL